MVIVPSERREGFPQQRIAVMDDHQSSIDVALFAAREPPREPFDQRACLCEFGSFHVFCSLFAQCVIRPFDYRARKIFSSRSANAIDRVLGACERRSARTRRRRPAAGGFLR
jgi:hypothetical protein